MDTGHTPNHISFAPPMYDVGHDRFIWQRAE